MSGPDGIALIRTCVIVEAFLLLTVIWLLSGCAAGNVTPPEISCQIACRGGGGRMLSVSYWWPGQCSCDYSQMQWPPT